MSTLQQQLVCDASTLANFKQWAQAVSTAFSTFGWTQSADTGQVNWSTISTVPGNNVFVYEIWQPNDGFTNTFYVKVEYGNVGGSNNPALRLSIGTLTNGAGTLAGFATNPTQVGINSTPPSTTTTYACYFSGAPGRIGVCLWPNAPSGNNCGMLFAVERSVNASGAYTNSYVTLWLASVSGSHSMQATIVFGVGIPFFIYPNTNTTSWICRKLDNGGNQNGFNNSIPFDTCAPNVGYFDYQCTQVGAIGNPDVSNSVTFTVLLYGSTRTYIPFSPLNSQIQNVCVCMRFD